MTRLTLNVVQTCVGVWEILCEDEWEESELDSPNGDVQHLEYREAGIGEPRIECLVLSKPLTRSDRHLESKMIRG